MRNLSPTDDHRGSLACRPSIIERLCPSATDRTSVPSMCHHYSGADFVPERDSPAEITTRKAKSFKAPLVTYAEAAEATGKSIQYIGMLHGMGTIGGHRTKKLVNLNSLEAHIAIRRLNNKR